MSIASYSSRLIVAFLFCLSTLSQPALSNTADDPRQIYHKAWQLVRDKYFDDHFNGQSWSAWEHRFDGQLKSRNQAFHAIEQMLASLNDPYTRVLEPKAFEEELALIDSHLVGIGISLEESKDKAHLMVEQVVEGSPADRAGIKDGDELVAVDGKKVSGLSIDDAGSKITGQEGTEVLIAVNRASAVRDLKVKREKLVLHSVSYKVLDPNIGLIRVSNFLFDDAARDFRIALHKLSKTDGLIIDLRRNPGGLIANAIRMADMLLEEGPIVTTIDRRDRQTDVASGFPVTRQPIVLLVDKDSASASEILAAALKDHGRAVIVGTQTFGKGLVQEINPLPGGGALHITIARYVSPNGTEINHVGVSPNIQVPTEVEQMNTALTLLKRRIATDNRPRDIAGPVPAEKDRT